VSYIIKLKEKTIGTKSFSFPPSKLKKKCFPLETTLPHENEKNLLMRMKKICPREWEGHSFNSKPSLCRLPFHFNRCHRCFVFSFSPLFHLRLPLSHHCFVFFFSFLQLLRLHLPLSHRCFVFDFLTAE